MDMRRARQAVEKKDEQLGASRRILEAQEDELFVSDHLAFYIDCTALYLSANIVSQQLLNALNSFLNIVSRDTNEN